MRIQKELFPEAGKFGAAATGAIYYGSSLPADIISKKVGVKEVTNQLKEMQRNDTDEDARRHSESCKGKIHPAERY